MQNFNCIALFYRWDSRTAAQGVPLPEWNDADLDSEALTPRWGCIEVRPWIPKSQKTMTLIVSLSFFLVTLHKMLYNVLIIYIMGRLSEYGTFKLLFLE